MWRSCLKAAQQSEGLSLNTTIMSAEVLYEFLDAQEETPLNFHQLAVYICLLAEVEASSTKTSPSEDGLDSSSNRGQPLQDEAHLADAPRPDVSRPEDHVRPDAVRANMADGVTDVDDGSAMAAAKSQSSSAPTGARLLEHHRQVLAEEARTRRHYWLSSSLVMVLAQLMVMIAVYASVLQPACSVYSWSHGTGLIITPQKSHRFSHIFRTCHAHARSPCCVHGRSAFYHTQTCRTSDEKL